MYFKKAGNKIQVLAYRGYDKDKKRAIVKMVGSISGYTFSPSVAHGSTITEAEYAEINAYIETIRQASQKALQKYAALDLAGNVGKTVEAIKTGLHVVDAQWARDVWTHLDELGRVLRKSGHGKHKTIRGCNANDKANSQTEQE